MSDELKLKISLLPDSPGVYRYKNSDGEIIYVGKAKNLKRRVSSYFNKVHAVARTNVLVRNIHDLEYTVVNNEEEALDLENSLIKELQPRYNVMLKDDKSYPWICVTNEMYPRVFMTRDALPRGAKSFGPYPKVEVAKTIMDLIRELYPIRTCRHSITPETISALKHRLCLQYHIKNCEGCCQGKVSADKYKEYMDEIRQILNGDTKQLCDYLIEEMTVLSSQLRFEEAEVLKRKYMLVDKYRARSVVVTPQIHNTDVFSLVRDETAAYVNYLHLRHGSIVQCFTLEFRLQQNEIDETDGHLMSLSVEELRHRFAETYQRDDVKETIVNVLPDTEFADIHFMVPQRGDKRKLLEISLKNAEQYRADKIKRMEKLNPEQRTTRLLTQIQKDLHLPELPRRIECFDNSNIQGAQPVASCVVFVNGKPSKRDYRHFNIKTVEGPDDFASMKEVINRRYSRLLAEMQDLPQLIVLDGGKGQISAAIEALDEIGLHGQISVVGIAKRLDEIYFPGDSVPLYVDKNSETLRVIQRLRDESHRFGIEHHRNRRSKAQIKSELDDIKGIGPATKTILLKHFKSLKRLRQASLEQIAAVVGEKKASSIHEHLNAERLNILINEDSNTES